MHDLQRQRVSCQGRLFDRWNSDLLAVETAPGMLGEELAGACNECSLADEGREAAPQAADARPPVRVDRQMTWSGEYASSIVRHTFDRSSPISQYATVPKAFVFIQRINLGLYALLGELGSTGNYRRIAEELWPFVDGPPSTPIGEAEAAWLSTRG